MRIFLYFRLILRGFIRDSSYRTYNYSWAYPALAKMGLKRECTLLEVGSWDSRDAINITSIFGCDVEVFEPSAINFLTCIKNVSSEKTKIQSRITIHNTAVSDHCGEVDFFEVDPKLYENSGASSLFQIDFKSRTKTDPDFNRNPVQFQRKVNSICLNHFLQKKKFANDLFLLLDTQGAELKILQGLNKYLPKFKVIILEGSGLPNYVDAPKIEDIHYFLIDKGYTLHRTQFFNSKLSGLKQISENHAKYLMPENNFMYIRSRLWRESSDTSIGRIATCT